MQVLGLKRIRGIILSPQRLFRRFSSSRRMELMESPGARLPLPKNLNPLHIKKAVAYIEKQTADLVDLYLEQANVFSAIIGIFGVKGLHSVSPYKKHKHPD